MLSAFVSASGFSILATMRGRSGVTEHPVVGFDLPGAFTATGRQDEPGNGRYAGQRLAAETQRHDGLEVIEACDLAGRVPGQCQRHFVTRDSGTVIADTDQLLTARHEIDLDRPRAGIQAVFDELLDDRRRSLNDLAGRDLVDEVSGKLANGHHAILSEVATARKATACRLAQEPTDAQVPA